MKRFLIKAFVFIAVAVGTAFLVNQFNNRGLDRVSSELDEPTLPYVYLEFEGKVINRTCGYTQTMSTSLMRDGIVPLNSNHGVTQNMARHLPMSCEVLQAIPLWNVATRVLEVSRTDARNMM